MATTRDDTANADRIMALLIDGELRTMQEIRAALKLSFVEATMALNVLNNSKRIEIVRVWGMVRYGAVTTD